ncbi:MAG: (2Fe-2S)-binding protein [Ilumatobacteraceae bacterium]
MTTQLDDVVAQVQARVSYLRCSAVAPADDGWIASSQLIGDPIRMRAEIDTTAAGRGTDDAQVAASLFTQAYAFRMPSIALAAFALGLPVPTTAPDMTAIRIGRHRPAELAILQPDCREISATDLVAELFEGHLVPFVETVRDATRIGQRLLWGNVAASLATISRAVDVAPMGDAAVRAKAVEFQAAAAPWLDGLGEFSTIETPDAVGWYWNRTSCCLWYQTTSAFYCDDCSLNDPVAQHAKRLAELTGSTTS